MTLHKRVDVGTAAGRECGSCTVCCTMMAVPDLNKKENTVCKHATCDGCGHYKERPGDCREFNCHWLQSPLGVFGPLDKELRPDRCGFLMTISRDVDSVGSACINIYAHDKQVPDQPGNTLERFLAHINAMRVDYRLVWTWEGEA